MKEQRISRSRRGREDSFEFAGGGLVFRDRGSKVGRRLHCSRFGVGLEPDGEALACVDSGGLAHLDV